MKKRIENLVTNLALIWEEKERIENYIIDCGECEEQDKLLDALDSIEIFVDSLAILGAMNKYYK